MSKKELLDILDKTSEIEKLLTPMGGSVTPELKTIYRKKDFLNWKEELKHQLRKLKQEPLIIEILTLLDEGFKTGFSDEKNFGNLRGKLETLSYHLDEYCEGSEEATVIMISQKLKKGTKIKTAFDEYTLLGQIGLGGNARVFSAQNNDEGLCAIKFVEQNLGISKLKRFRNEISFCEHHQHGNVVKIIDRGYVCLDDKDYVFYVMPLYKESLKDKIKEGIPHEKVIGIFVGILKGLKYAHEHECIHRDIKPDNIMFAEESWEPIICDFGIAHFAEEDLLTIVETRATDRMANFQYAAPEQRQKGGNICCQTDIYALALILNEMFTGEIPQAVGHKTIKDINPDFEYLDDLFAQLYKQKPEERLYPEDRILSELKLLSDRYNKDKTKQKLEEAVEEFVKPEEFRASIVRYEYERGALIFVFDKDLPKDWIQMIVSGSFTAGCVLGYDKSRLKKTAENKLYMPIRGDENADTIKTITTYMKEWVKSANVKYSAEIERKIKAEYTERERQRKVEIEKIEKDNAMMSIVKNLN